jgi:phosphoglycerate dehydrogenase-like enzyme
MNHSSPVEVLVTIPFSESQIEQLKEVSPLLQITLQPTNRVDDIPSKRWLQTEILYTNNLLPDLSLTPNLRWIQLHSAGADLVLQSPQSQNSNLVITTLSGANASQVAEFAMMLLLALGHNLSGLVMNQSRLEWSTGTSEGFYPPRELRGSVVGIVGYGSIGRAIAHLLQPFGVTVLAVKKDAMNPKDTGYTPPSLGDPEGDFFHRLYPMQAIKSMLKECDFIIITLPLTPATKNIISKDILSGLKPSSYLINVSRGGVIDEPALITALQEHHLAGAALDVFNTEPLPADSPLWKMPNVILTPHVAGASRFYKDRAIALFIENIRRYLSGKPLINKIDIQRGY